MKNDTELHLDADGNINTAYYIRQARQLRSDYVATLITRVKNKFKALFHIQLPSINADRPAQH
ncbi:RSP_7527 family protein [Neptunomonas sp.]|uniref:RSP_7527 family protein n=1 Tax=Neptunomonas sp. TaxID=1971898 RepID=UPI0035619A44